ncbi:serine protease [Micromonospora haikouensis]|uniref:S1 family peptidase n=1 Tax=Micromonospora haikouensis TaxID=686309 RepID=UPI0036B3E331
MIDGSDVISTGADVFLGRVLNQDGVSVGTCFQVHPGVLVTAFHVLQQALAIDPDLELEVGRVVYFSSLDGPDSLHFPAQVFAVDKRADLAVLKAENALSGSISHLMRSDIPQPGDEFQLVGFGTLRESYFDAEYMRLSARGRWNGVERQGDGFLIASGDAPGTAKGMSGCPVIRGVDNAVIGVLSGRYNSVDGWSHGRVWISRVESLLPLIPPGVSVPLQQVPVPAVPTGVSALTVSELDRISLTSDERFFLPDAWRGAWEEGTSAFSAGQILVVKASPGVGATTFASSLLARATPDRTKIVQLEPGDWDSPTASAIPSKPHCAYLLDLKDPDHDLPSPAFMRDLEKTAQLLNGLQSRLVLTIRESLLRGLSLAEFSHVHVVRLVDPPDPRALVLRHLGVQAPQLVSVAKSEDVARHLDGMNAVQAAAGAAAIENLADGWSEDSAETSTLIARIAQSLDSYVGILDLAFTDSSKAPSALGGETDADSPQQNLSAADRCLLLALSFKGKSRIALLEEDAQRLSSMLAGRVESAGKKSLYDVLAGPGVRGRLRTIGAKIAYGETAVMARPAMATAVVRYVWDNYKSLRETLVDWLLQAELSDSGEFPNAASWISGLIKHSQDIDFVKNELRRVARKQSHDAVLAAVLSSLISDAHFRRQCDRLLYDWAERVELQPVVIEVARRDYISSLRPIVLRRLQRVADAEKTNPKVPDLILQAFRAFIASDRSRNSFENAVELWVRDYPTNMCAQYAAMAMIGSGRNVEWLMGLEDRGIRIGGLLAQLMLDPAGHASIGTLFASTAGDVERYEWLVVKLAEAAQEDGAILGILGLSSALRGLGIAQDPMADLADRLELRLPRISGGG